jgi:hypothetical protein
MIFVSRDTSCGMASCNVEIKIIVGGRHEDIEYD